MAEIRYKGQIYSGAASFGSADDVSYDNTTSGLTADNVQEAVDDLASIVQERKNITTSGSFSKVVTKNTEVIVDKIVVPSGTWLIMTYMDLANSGTGTYNHRLGTRTVRSPEAAGGGSINFCLADGVSDVEVRAYTTTIDTTVRVQYSMIKLH